jgi:hypothetical protein
MKFRTVPENAISVRPEPVAGWLDDNQCHGSGKGRIHRISALLEHVQASLNGERLGSGDHVTREDWRAAGSI